MMLKDNAPELRAGGTDIMERRRSGISTGPVLDIGQAGGEIVQWRADGGLDIGASCTIDTLANDDTIGVAYPGLVAAAGALATPQIRRVGTLGGNLLQRNRCWYYRNPNARECLKKGADSCAARAGNHQYHALFDLGPCISVHPSTLGAALLAYDGKVSTDRRAHVNVSEVWGDGADGRRDHQLGNGEVLTRVHLPPPAAGEHAAYTRATSRAYAEWPLVEAIARIVMSRGRILFAAVAAGGIAPVPLRLRAVEAALIGYQPTAKNLAEAAKIAVAGVTPLPMTGYKAALLIGSITEVLERSLPALE